MTPRLIRRLRKSHVCYIAGENEHSSSDTPGEIVPAGENEHSSSDTPKRLMKDKCKVGFRTDRQIVVFEPYRHKWKWIDGIYRYVRLVIKLKYVIIRSDARL